MGQTDKQAVTVQPHNRIRWVTSYTQEWKYTKIQPKKNMQRAFMLSKKKQEQQNGDVWMIRKNKKFVRGTQQICVTDMMPKKNKKLLSRYKKHHLQH